ncbi:MAG: hypothetical protein ACYC2K_01015 [Gemmatimonadales bacterium]
MGPATFCVLTVALVPAVPGEVAWCFAAQASATALGASGFLVSDPALGRVLLASGQIGVFVLPMTIAIVWVVEAHRRGDI